MLVSDVIGTATTSGALRILDKEATGRWTAATTLPFYNLGVQEVFSRRPELRLTVLGELTTFADATATTDTSLAPDQMKQALIWFVCAMALSDDARDEMDRARSAQMMANFEKALAL